MEATLCMSRHHVPHNDLSVMAAGGQERRGTLCNAKHVILMAVSLGTETGRVILNSWKIKRFIQSNS